MITEHDLEQFTGTTRYYNYQVGPFRSAMVLSDGTKYLTDTVGCNWLYDIIATEILPLQTSKGHDLIVIKLSVLNNQMDIHTQDGDYHELLPVKHIDFTDFPTGEWELWLVSGLDESVLMLPSEY